MKDFYTFSIILLIVYPSPNQKRWINNSIAIIQTVDQIKQK